MEIGMIFTEEHYADAYGFVTEHQGCFIREIDPIDGVRYFKIEAVPEPTVEEKNETIRQTRAKLYAELVDPLHAQKDKDIIMGEWSEEREQAYITEVKRLTIKIREENPYIE
jgi:hypothetical protein